MSIKEDGPMTKKDLGIPWTSLDADQKVLGKKILSAHKALIGTQEELRVLERSLELQVDELERVRRRRIELVALGNDTSEAVCGAVQRLERRQRGWDRTWERRLFELLEEVRPTEKPSKKSLSVEEQYDRLRALAKDQGVELPEFAGKKKGT